jgi:hypothetical protein
MTDLFACWLSDARLFPLLQIALVAFALVCFLVDRFHGWRAGGGSKGQDGVVARVQLTVTRGPTSMALFYGAYLTLTGVFVSLALQVDLAKNYRVLFGLLDSLVVAYVCLWNHWFRNKLVGWSARLASIESR